MSLSSRAFAQDVLPHGGTVVGGAATINQVGPNLNVTTQTDRAIIDWQGFSIGAGNAANFIQPGIHSSVLNRVTTPNNPSAIYGALNSNGNVLLVNPAGIVIGPSGTINTNGFTGSVLDIANDEFMRGEVLRFRGDSKESILNQGTIRTGNEGATLIGSQVINQGLIESNGGNINLLAGGSATLKGGGVYTQADQATIQSGISETAHLIRNSGTLRATGAAEIGGEVYLVSPGGKVIQEAVIAAQKADAAGALHGGNLVIDSGAGETIVKGSTSASGKTGGTVTVTGEKVSLRSATIDASGQDGGGTIRIGGGYQGSDSTIANSQATLVDAASTINASATASGDGGSIVLWSDGQTLFQGSLYAQGGALGSGGFAEVSGKQLLKFEGHVNTGGGTLLLDPYNYTVDATAAGNIVAALGSNNVVLQTTSDNASYGSSGNATDAGDITVNSDVVWSSEYALTLLAHRDIHFNANVQNSGAAGAAGDLNIVAGWDGTTPFDAANFLAADVASPGFYGVDNNGSGSGSVHIGSGSQASGMAVGSAHGQTNVFAHDLTLRGSDTSRGHAQLGFHHTSGGASGATVTTGKINVAVSGALTATGGRRYGISTEPSSYVQIGHGGKRSASSDNTPWTYGGDIHVSAGEDITFSAGSGTFAYAQLGSGGQYAHGAHSGNHTILAAEDITFRASANYAYSQLGNGGYEVNGNQIGDHKILLANNVLFRGSAFYSYAQFGNGGLQGSGDSQGSHEIVSANDITFQGFGKNYASAHFGNGGSLRTGNHTGGQKIGIANDVKFLGGAGSFAYAMFGNGGVSASGTHSGSHVMENVRDVELIAGTRSLAFAQMGNGGAGSNGSHAGGLSILSARNITIQSNSSSFSSTSSANYAQLGNGGDSTNGDYSGDILIGNAANLIIRGGPGGSYNDAQIGHGAAQRSWGARDGDIAIHVSGETSLNNGSHSWVIGHRSADSIANADITFLTGTLDYSSAGTSSMVAIESQFINNFSPLLANGNITIGATNGTAGSSGGMQIDAPLSFANQSLNLISTSDIRFNSGVQIGGNGSLSVISGWDGATGLNGGASFGQFDSAIFLSTTGSYGSDAGSIYIGSATASGGVAVGSAHGATTVMGHDLILRGSDSSLGYAQLGYHHVQGGADGETIASGEIAALLTGDLSAEGGGQSPVGYTATSYVQIGHGGNRRESMWDDTLSNYSGRITVETDGGLRLLSGSGLGSYAHVGHGGYQGWGNYSGDIDVIVSDSMNIAASSTNANYAQIGNGGRYSTGTYSGAISIVAGGNLNLSSATTAGNYAMIGNGNGGFGFATGHTVFGDVDVSVGHDATIANGIIGNRLGLGGNYSSGVTTMVVGASDLTTSNTTSFLSADEKSRFYSADEADGGGLRFYGPRSSSFQFADDALLNGVAASTFPDSGLLPNVQGRYLPSAGPYDIDASAGNFAFYLQMLDLIVGANDGSSTYGDTPVNPGLSLVGGVLHGTDTFASIGLANNFNLTAALDADTYTLSVDATDLDSGYNLLQSIDGTFTINKAALAITAADQAKTYGDLFVFGGSEFSASGLKNDETVGSVALSSSGAAATASATTHDIAVANATGGTFDTGNYDISYVDGELAVGRAALTITALDQEKEFASPAILDGTNGFSAAGLKNGETIGSVSMVSPGIPAAAVVGSYPIFISGPTGGTVDFNNYDVTLIDGTLVVIQNYPNVIDVEGVTHDSFTRYQESFYLIGKPVPPGGPGSITLPAPTNAGTQNESEDGAGAIPFDLRMNSRQISS